MGEALDKLVALSGKNGRFGRDGDGDGILNEGKDKPGKRAATFVPGKVPSKDELAKRAADPNRSALHGGQVKTGNTIRVKSGHTFKVKSIDGDQVTMHDGSKYHQKDITHNAGGPYKFDKTDLAVGKPSKDTPIFDSVAKPKEGGALDKLYATGLYNKKGQDDFGREHISGMSDRDLDSAIAERTKLNAVKKTGMSGGVDLKFMQAEKERRTKANTYDPETDKNFEFTPDEQRYLDYHEDEYETFADMVTYAKTMRNHNAREAKKKK